MVSKSEGWMGGLAGKVLLVLVVCLLRAQISSTQSILATYSETDKLVDTISEQHYVFGGDGINYKCLCQNSGIVSLRWKLRGVVLAEQNQCLTVTYELRNASSLDDGEYICEMTFTNRTTISKSAGTLRVVDPTRIQAPPEQHGLIDTTVVLNCSTTFEETSTISYTWTHDGEMWNNNGQIERVSLNNEGMYKCSVLLASYGGLRMERKINFSVIVPPTITAKPEDNYHLSGNQPVTFPVQFQSRFQTDTVIVWYKNEDTAVPQDLIQTSYENDLSGRTQVQFQPLRRRDAGVYRVVIENTFQGIPVGLRQTETSFRVQVTVLPIAPSNIMLTEITTNNATITWSLANQNEDDLPDNITATLLYSNGTAAGQYVVMGSQREVNVDLVPGMTYTVRMTAANQDGRVESDSATFQSVSGAPSKPALSIVRGSNMSLCLNISLAYTGGGNISHFTVSFRRIGTTDWIRIEGTEAIQSELFLQWKAVVTHEGLLTPGIELQVLAVNSRGYSSEPSSQPEPIGLPGPPRQPAHISSSHDSILIQVQLSSVGAPPILFLEVDFLSHPTLNHTIDGPFQLGELVQASIDGLQEDTLYRFAIVAVNYGGRGEASLPIEVRTDKLPPVPLYGIVFIALGAALLIIIFVICFALLARYIYNTQKSKREYKFPSGTSSDAVKHLESNDQLVSGTKRPLRSLSSPTPSSTFSDRPLSQSAYSRQCSVSTYPLSPQRTISTSDGGSSPTERFHFERRDSSGTSVNTDTESETNHPRYTYKVSPSPTDLATPQIRAHSLHSMQSYHSTATRLTSNTSTSTRESIDSPAEFNATNV